MSDERRGGTGTAEGVCRILPDEKRCYLPGIILRSTCPNCGREDRQDLADHYLSYGDTDVGWSCEGEEKDESGEWVTEGCGHSWRTLYHAEIRLRPESARTFPPRSVLRLETQCDAMAAPVVGESLTSLGEPCVLPEGPDRYRMVLDALADGWQLLGPPCAKDDPDSRAGSGQKVWVWWLVWGSP